MRKEVREEEKNLAITWDHRNAGYKSSNSHI